MKKRILGVALCLGATFVFPVFLIRETYANPGTNINSTNRWAWNNVTGWVDFYETDTVMVTSSVLSGYASSSVGDISLDCATTAIGNICGTSNYGVCNGPGPHNPDGTCPLALGGPELTGYGWNDALGWISFNCDESSHPGGTDTCSTSNYKVSIDQNGEFHGYSWNDIAGWISFNCANPPDSCLTVDYKLDTSWSPKSAIGYLESSTIDTEKTGGVALQSVVWQGNQPPGTSVDFQFAVSNCPNGAANPPLCDTGGWVFKGPPGPGENINYYGNGCPQAGTGNAGPNVPICVDQNQVVGFRYLRYKVRLQSDPSKSQTPTIDNIILNWTE